MKSTILLVRIKAIQRRE